MSDMEAFMIVGALIFLSGCLFAAIMHWFFKSDQGGYRADLLDAYKNLETAEQRQQLLDIVENFSRATPAQQKILYDTAREFRVGAESRDLVQRFNLEL